MKSKNLACDDCGAIMLIAVFFAIFAVALLYYLVGISDSILFREKFQDAADSAALSAAILHARAMNLIVLINIIMAALLAVLVTLKLLETLSIIGIALAFAAAWISAGSSMAAIPPLKTIQSNMHGWYESLKSPIFETLRALNETATAVSTATPVAALALVEADIEARGNPPGMHGVTFGTRITLPVENDAFSELCGRAGEVPIQLSSALLSPLPGVSSIIDTLNGPMHELTSTFSDWFCSDGSKPPQPYSQPLEQSYPSTDTATKCEKDGAEGSMSDLQHATSQSCTDSHNEEVAAEPDKTTGECQTGHDCSLSGPYSSHVKLAREQCDPSSQSAAPSEYRYQTRSGHVEYHWNGKAWVRGKPNYDEPRAASNPRPPCGAKEFDPLFAEDYNKAVRKHDDVNEVLPVCSNEHPPSSFDRSALETTRFVEFTEVTQILGCKRNKTKKVDLSDAARANEVGSDKSPKRVNHSATLGDEDFQLRAIMHANVPTELPENVMRLALWNQPGPKNPLSPLRELGNYSIAQAEYFYDGPMKPRGDWMWAMNWRARLRRFRVPTGNASTVLNKVCGDLGGTCSLLTDQLKRLSTILVH